MRFIYSFIFLMLTAACGAETFGKFASVVPIKPPQTPANSSVSVTVNGTGAAALLYADNGTTRLTNPIRADAYGAYQFQTATGVYDITMTRADGTVSTWTKVVIGFASSAIPWDTPGTIGSTTPNTGAFTTISATGQITSTLAIGTAPLAITSTTLVPNLYVARSALADVGTTVTTNHNMTGPITGTGNVTSITAQTGTGTTFAMQTSPALVTPLLGTPTSGVLTNCTGTAAGLTAGNVTTNANLTGPITSVGNVTSITAQTGTGTTFVMDTSPTLVTPTLGAATATSITSGSFTDSGLTPGRVTTAGASGLLQDFAGLAIVGTPSATAPSTGTNGPGLLSGMQIAGANGSGVGTTIAAYGNGVAQNNFLIGYLCQGTAASPGATILNDTLLLALRGHDGTNFTSQAAQIQLRANSTWSPTNHESFIQFSTVANASTSSIVAGRIDPNGSLVMGGAFNSVGTFSAGTQRPHIQTSATSASFANLAQSLWIANASGPTSILAKSRSGTVGTQGVITTGDTLGTMSLQGDDGTNFIEAASIVGLCEGTIGTGQVPGRLRIRTATSAGTVTTGYTMDSQQVSMFGAIAATLGSTLYTGGTVTPRVQVIGTSATTSSSPALSLAMFSNNTSGGSLYFGKSRSGTIGTMTAATTGDTLGNIDFQASDGTNFNSAAKIIATTTGTLAGSRTPGQLVFQTGVDAAGSALTTAMTITNAQVIQENGTTEASAVGTANVVNSGGLGVAKRSFLGTIGSTFKGNVEAGVQDATAAAAGQVGEVLTGAQSTPTNFTTTATIQQLATISLTDGDWLETATMTLAMNGATEVAAAEAICYLDDTTASATGAVEGETIGYIYEPASGSSVHATVTIIYHEVISAAKTKYLNGQATWTAGQPKYTCSMKAVRIR